MKKALLSLMAAALVSSALAETKVAYSWTSAPSLDDEGKQVGIVTEVGGKIVYTNGDGERVNYLQGNYYTVCLNGKKGNLNDAEASANAGHMVLTLDEALKEGDKITMTGFRNKNAEGKNASVYMLLENGTEFAGVEGGSYWTNIYADDTNADYDGDGSNPSSYTWTVPAAEAGTKVIKMTRNDGGTNLFITNIVIETEAAAEAAEYATVTVDDSNLVKLVSGATREEINLNAGTGNLSAGEYMIQPAQRGYTLNKVELNGEAVALSWGYYAVELKADDKLVITAKYESDEVFYEFGAGYRNDIAAAVKSIKQANGRDLTELFGNRGAANTGWEVSIDIDTENYRLDSIMVNGEKINGTSFVALESGVVEVYAEAYEVKRAYVVTNDPACATIETIGTNGNHAYTLHSETEVTFNGVTIKTLKITPAEGAQITVKNGETEVTAEYGEYRVDLVDSITVTITNNVVAEYATVTVDNSNKVKLTNENREEINLNAGSAKLSAGNYMIVPAQRGYTLNKVELNGEAIAATYGYYAVELKADDKLNIVADYEADEVLYEIGAGYRNDITAAVKSIKQANGRDLTELFGNRGAANTGWEVSIDIDTENYRLDSIMVNGEKINGTSFVALESGVVEIYAEAYEVKRAYVVTNDPACATIETIGINGNHAYTLHSETEVAFNGVTVKTLKITPAEGAQITVLNGETEVTAENGEYRVDLVDSLTVTITNNTVAEYATATVDNSNKVKLTNENREDINLNAGTAQLSAGNYMIVPAQRGYTLNKVELNGEAVAATYGYYAVELKAGDKLNIVADYEADEVVYEIGSGYRNDITAAVKSISQANGRDLTSLLGNRGAANTGWEVNFEIDTENYQLDSIMVNGEKINGTSFVALEGGMIEIFATAIPEQTATLKVCHASDVTAELIAAVNEPIALVDGENAVKFNANKPNLKLTVAEGLVVTVNGTVAAAEYDGTYTIALTEGAVIEVSEGSATGIAAIEAAQAGQTYGINGVRTNAAKGFVILNGKKAYIK